MKDFFKNYSLLQRIYVFLLALLSLLLIVAFVQLRQSYLVYSNQQDLVQIKQVLNPYASTPILANYARYQDAIDRQDSSALQQVAFDSQGTYLEYESVMHLARMENLPAVERVGYYQRGLELFSSDGLLKHEKNTLRLEFADFAEQAGLAQTAIAVYEDALPDDKAIAGLERLQTNPYQLANAFQKARLNNSALRALGSLKAPSIDAPAYRALRENDKALQAYNDWLVEEPNNSTALLGKAWILFRQGDYTQADAIFASLAGSDPLLGRGLIAEIRKDYQTAASFYTEGGSQRYLWELAEILEGENQVSTALDVYMDLASSASTYTDDAAYRAYVLAQRQGDANLTAQARALIPANSFFRLTLGETFDLGLTINRPIGQPVPPVIDLADALVLAGNTEAAEGELSYALRNVSTEEDLVLIGTKLNSLGSYMEAARKAQRFIDGGSKNLDVWRIAYPLAYPDMVFEQAQVQGLEPTLIWSVMRVESVFFPRAISRSNARGLMQFIDSTWTWMAERMGESPSNPYEPVENIRYGAEYLRYLIDYFDGDVELAVPAYNGGQGFIKRLYEGSAVNQNKSEYYTRIDKTETREYLQKVLATKEIYRILYNNP